MDDKRVYYYEEDNLKIKISTARYHFSLPFLKNKIVIDIGCGARRGPKIACAVASKVIGLDISTEAIVYCRRIWFAENLSYIAADARSLPLKNNSFDVALSFEVIEHIDNFNSYLDGIHRILKKGGVLIISTPNRIIVSPNGIFSNPDHLREFDYHYV